MPEDNETTQRQPVPVPASTRWSAWITIGLVGLLTLVTAAAAAAQWYLRLPESIPDSPPTSVANLDGEPFVSPSPVLRAAPHRTGSRAALVGPVFADTESTREMKLRGFPFTFVTPRSWGCLAATVKLDAQAWRCIDEQAGQGRPQLDIVVRHCPGPCTDAHRAEVDAVLAHPPTYTVRDPATRLAERTIDGRYVLTVNRVFATTPGGPADWMVVVEAQARPADAATVQRIVNDIYSQTL